MADRAYTIGFQNQTVGNISVAYLRPSASQAIEIVRCWLTCSANATAEMARVQMVTQAVSGSPAYTTAAGVALDKGLAAAGATCSITGSTSCAAGGGGTIATTESGGARTVLAEEAFNRVNGWVWIPGPKERIILPAGYASIFALYLPAAPATTGNWSGGINFVEL